LNAASKAVAAPRAAKIRRKDGPSPLSAELSAAGVNGVLDASDGVAASARSPRASARSAIASARSSMASARKWTASAGGCMGTNASAGLAATGSWRTAWLAS